MKKKILIVDDDEDMLTISGMTLSRAGYDVIKAANGKEAIAMAKNSLPDLIMLDVRMPGLDGGATTDALRSNQSTRNIPIVYFSNLVDKNEVNEGHVLGSKLGDVRFIPKACSREELLEEVRRSLENQE